VATSTPLQIVTGKGGTGKTTVAAAMALAAAAGGKRVLLCEVEGRQQIAQLFDVAPLGYEELPIARASGGGRVHALAIDPEAALLEYLKMYYRLGPAGRALDRFGIIDFATTIAPGVRDVLLTGKIYEAARRRVRPDGPFVYDQIVVDAPPTGRITKFLGVNEDVATLAKVGPIKNQSTSIMQMMRGPQTRVHVVTVLEEMPVQETIDGINELTTAGFRAGHVVVNLKRPELLSAPERLHEFDAGDLGAALARVGLVESAASSLLVEGLEYEARQELQAEQQALLEAEDYALVELPLVPDGIDLAALLELSELLTSTVAR
jgi:anion-transporting  ArsA/GET3 family ATPase